MASIKTKRKCLTLDTKMEIIRAVDAGAKKAEVGRQYAIVSSTLSTILKNRDDIKSRFESSKFQPSRKRCRTALLEDVEEALLRWFQGMRAKNLPVNGPLLREKAERLSEMLGHGNFQASSGWLSRFKERHGILHKQICGESASVDPKSLTTWLKETLPGIIRGYEAKDIFNADETGLFYRLTPDKTLSFKGEQCHGGKQSKERMTVMLCSNMDGSEKLKPLVIGKFKNPRCFKNVQSLPVTYRANRKAWMVSDLFTEWVRRLDRKFSRQSRKVLLFVDNCAAHPKVQNLQAITLQFLPPNTTSHLQPMDQGVIMNMKVHYRKHLVKSLLHSYDSGETPKPIDVKQAISMLFEAWKNVKPVSIGKCFAKAGFVEDGGETDDDGENGDGDEETGEDEAQPDNIWERMARHLDLPAVSFNDYLNADTGVRCTDEPTDAEIAEQVAVEMNGEEEEEEMEIEEEDDGDQQPTMSLREAHDTMPKLQDLLYSLKDTSSEVFAAQAVLSAFLAQKMDKVKSQRKITDFFQK